MPERRGTHMIDKTVVWEEWVKWLEEAQAAMEEMKRVAPRLDISSLTAFEPSLHRRYIGAVAKHTLLAKEGKRLLAKYLSADE